MQVTTIMQGAEYALESYGNGWAYCLRDLRGKRSLWLQDDDATAFREDLDALENAQPEWAVDQILHELADLYADVMATD